MSPQSSAGSSPLPAFLNLHMDDMYFRGMQEDWGEAHPLRGREPVPGSILLNSNDYLGLARNPAILRAQSEALLVGGQGALMSSAFLGAGSPHDALERRLAAFLGHESVLLTQSGWAVNVGFVQSIAGPNIPVYFDMMVHASFHEGIRSAGAPSIPFLHNDVEHLCDQIHENGPGIVLAESVYSTDGSLSPLPDLTRAAAELGCVVVIDESHSLGTQGSHGEGLVALLQLHPWVHAVTSSLSKAFVGRGGLIACSTKLREFVRFTSLPAIFSSALLQHEIAGLAAALDVIRAADERRRLLRENTNTLRKGLDELGYFVSSGSEQIIALEPGRPDFTLALRDALEARGVFGAVFCPPATAKNRSIVRLSVHSDLSANDLDRVLAVCAEIREEVRLDEWRSTRKRQINPA